jgi:hypothetical protein
MAAPIDTDKGLVHRSPPLGWLAIVFGALFMGSVAAIFVLTGFAPYPIPYNPIEELQNYYTRFPDAVRVVSLLQLGASIPLGVYAMTIVSRLLFLRINVAGVYIASFGGVAASVFLGVSGVATWIVSQPGVAVDAGAMRVASLLAFASGGFAHTAALGLLLAGVSVPSLAFGVMRPWICWFGLGVAVVCELSTISMLFPAASLLLPVGRFPALIWMIVAGFAMPKQRIAHA